MFYLLPTGFSTHAERQRQSKVVYNVMEERDKLTAASEPVPQPPPPPEAQVPKRAGTAPQTDTTARVQRTPHVAGL